MSAPQEFKEVIRPPWWLILFLYSMLYSFVFALWAAFDDSIALIGFIVLTLLGLGVIHFATVTITVAEGELRIRRAHIPLRYLGEAKALDREEFMRARTRDADPAAYFALIFWVSEGIKVEVNDDRDPTPYWLISTRRADRLIAALRG